MGSIHNPSLRGEAGLGVGSAGSMGARCYNNIIVSLSHYHELPSCVLERLLGEVSELATKTAPRLAWQPCGGGGSLPQIEHSGLIGRLANSNGITIRCPDICQKVVK